MPHVLNVMLHGRFVGTITNLASDHNLFAFSDEYANDASAPVLSLGFFNAERKLSVPVRTPHVRLLPFFANLLPEGHLRSYLARRAGVNPARDFPLLWLAGEDLPGAVVVSHADGLTTPPDDPDVTAVTEAEAENDPGLLKFSLAGVQLKFSAILEADGGLTIPVHGVDGDWMVKMPSPTYARVPENEHAMLHFAARVGIDVPEHHLVDTSTVRNLPAEVRSDLGRAMSIKRFDRTPDGRVHIEDFNQIFGQYPADKYKYASYGNMLAGIWQVLGEEQTREFVRRLIFNAAIGNGDMHLKNWSVIYRDTRTPALAPAYDYVSTIVYVPNDKLALSIAKTRSWSDISDELLERFARRAGVPRGVVLRAAREMADRVRETWPAFKRETELDPRTLRLIDEHMATVPLLTGRRSTAVAVPSDDADPVLPQPEIA
ncbi:MAG TPA: HipA domain-containing protein [Candidatus Elarobacter sp.]|jgi:serine/threonine-protein kinase HipA|nr:HipA domain-containing protein [Candidatus Elarobacter sp.]